jgi:hypothetical protein
MTVTDAEPVFEAVFMNPADGSRASAGAIELPAFLARATHSADSLFLLVGYFHRKVRVSTLLYRNNG